MPDTHQKGAQASQRRAGLADMSNKTHEQCALTLMSLQALTGSSRLAVALPLGCLEGTASSF